MAGYAGGANGTNGSGGGGGGGDLEALFAQLRQRDAGNGAVTAPGPAQAAGGNSHMHAQLPHMAPVPPNFNYMNSFVPFQQQPPPPGLTNLPMSMFGGGGGGPVGSPGFHPPPPVIANMSSQQPQMPNLTRSASSSGRTTDLLSLLKFSQPSTSSNPASSPTTARETAPSLDAQSVNAQGATSASLSNQSANLLAAIMGSSQPKPSPAATPASVPVQAAEPAPVQPQMAAKSPPANPFAGPPAPGTQAYLLSLLQRPKPAQQAQSPLLEESAPPTQPSDNIRHENNVSSVSRESTLDNGGNDTSSDYVMLSGSTIEQQQAKDAQPLVGEPKGRPGIFTYVNPFEQLAASSPRNLTPKPVASDRLSPAPSTSRSPQVPPSTSSPSFNQTSKVSPVQILKNPRHDEDLEEALGRKQSPTFEKTSVEPYHPTPTPAPFKETDDTVPTTVEESNFEIDHPVRPTETVAEALSNVGEQVDKEVEEALAQVDDQEGLSTVAEDLDALMNAKSDVEFDAAAQKAALDLKKELGKHGNEHLLEESLPTPVAEAVREIIDEAAQGHIADSWESADADESVTKDEDDMLVEVYSFPLKPWMALSLAGTDTTKLSSFRTGIIMDIARLRKDFDQIDRTLATASSNFIVYGMKNGGIRVIRQNDGKDTKLFAETQDRVFNVAISIAEDDSTEAIIGTGISGTVYWTLLKENGEDHTDALSEKHYFALPPLNSQDNESPGGVLKTRARKSTNHPEFFAVGRGKTIHIIWPSVIINQGYITNSPDRSVDVDKYLKSRTLKINTGKAGKDFIFSPDDTSIVSLDKAGRVKFWDVRTLTNPSRKDDLRFHSSEQAQPLEIKEPLQVLLTTQPNEKSWPTSVLLIDKFRPYVKGGPLRYLVVGMKQNHTLQLWDLSLGKPVQEINFPHEKESDAICSVLYHAATSMLIVGHPTRNSIYFIHLSAPKYTLSKNMSQAEYIEKVVANNPSFTKPDATAVFSGVREYSFESKGSLRSLDMLQSPAPLYEMPEDGPLFELYAMHSKGVTCLSIKREDVGWDHNSKVIKTVDAKEAGLVTIDSLKPLPVYNGTSSETNTPGESANASPSLARAVANTPKEILGRDSKKSSATKNAPQTASPQKPDAPIPVPINGKQEQPAAAPTDKHEKKKKNKKEKAAANRAAADAQAKLMNNTSNVTADSLPVPAPSSRAQSPGALPQTGGEQDTSQLGLSQATMTSQPAASTSVKSLSTSPAFLREMSGERVDDLIKMVETTQANVSDHVLNVIEEKLSAMQLQISKDKREQDASFDSRQEALLRMVSQTLSENVEATLGKVVKSAINQVVVPSITSTTQQALSEQIGSKLQANLQDVLPRELQSVLSSSITTALKSPELLKNLSDALSKGVAFRVEQQFATILSKSITPAFTSLAVQTSKKVGHDVYQQASEQIAALEKQREVDNARIEQLTHLVTSLTRTVSSMAASQASFQSEILHSLQSQSDKSTLDNLTQMVADLSDSVSSMSQTQSKFQSSGFQPQHSSRQSSVNRPFSSATAVTTSTPNVSARLSSVAADSPRQLSDELSTLGSLMEAGNADEACMHWLHSDNKQEIFDEFFSKFDPSFTQRLNPLVLLSLCTMLGAKLETNTLLERVDWLETILRTFNIATHRMDAHDVLPADLTPRILEPTIDRLESLMLRVRELSPQDPLVGRLVLMSDSARHVVNSIRGGR